MNVLFTPLPPDAFTSLHKAAPVSAQLVSNVVFSRCMLGELQSIAPPFETA